MFKSIAEMVAENSNPETSCIRWENIVRIEESAAIPWRLVWEGEDIKYQLEVNPEDVCVFAEVELLRLWRNICTINGIELEEFLKKKPFTDIMRRVFEGNEYFSSVIREVSFYTTVPDETIKRMMGFGKIEKQLLDRLERALVGIRESTSFSVRFYNGCEELLRRYYPRYTIKRYRSGFVDVNLRMWVPKGGEAEAKHYITPSYAGFSLATALACALQFAEQIRTETD